MSAAKSNTLRRMVRRALAPVVGDRFKMPDGGEKEVGYVTDDGLVGWRDKWETGQGPVYFDDPQKWSAIVRVWLGNGVTLVETNTGRQTQHA